MTPREILSKFFADADGDGHTLASDDLVALLMDFLKSEGLLIGPLVATPEMRSVGNEYTTCGGPCRNRAGAQAWSAMVAEWQRGEGA